MCIHSYKGRGLYLTYVTREGEVWQDVTGKWLQLRCGSGRRVTHCNSRYNPYLRELYRIHSAFHWKRPGVRTHVCRHEGHLPKVQWVSLCQRESWTIAFSLYIIKISWNQRLRVYKPFLYVNIVVSCLSVADTSKVAPRGHNKMFIRGGGNWLSHLITALFLNWYRKTKWKCICASNIPSAQRRNVHYTLRR